MDRNHEKDSNGLTNTDLEDCSGLKGNSARASYSADNSSYSQYSPSAFLSGCSIAGPTNADTMNNFGKIKFLKNKLY